MKIKILLAAIMIIISGCATVVNINQERFNTLPQHYSQFDLKIAWQTKTTDSGINIDGLVKNVRYFEMNDVEVWVSVLDGSGKTLGRSTSFFIPSSLRENEIASFNLSVPVRANAGTKLQFTYRYIAPEENDGSGYWMQSFEVAGPFSK